MNYNSLSVSSAFAQEAENVQTKHCGGGGGGSEGQLRDDRVPRVFLSVSVTAAAQRSGGGGGKGREETVGQRGGAAGEEKVQEVEVRRGKGRERARERTACLNHPTAGTVCAACVQFEHLIETDILHVPPSLCGLPAEL